MKVDPSRDDLAALARALGEHLAHRAGQGTRYLPRVAALVPPPAARADRGARSSGAPPTPVPAPAQPPAAPRTDTREALRQQAATWSPAMKLEYLRRRSVGDCQRCALARSRHNIVFGVGDPKARILFVGEGPGAEEDRRGEPFVGRAGKLLDHWLSTLGLARGDVYIANVLKCRPPGNRDPRPAEVDACSPFLHAQVRAIQPGVIVALGRHAGMLLARRDDLSLARMRGGNLSYRDPKHPDVVVPLIVTYHPAFVLRKEADPKDHAHFMELVLADLRRACRLAGVDCAGA